jgi:hypothetical protein
MILDNCFWVILFAGKSYSISRLKIISSTSAEAAHENAEHLTTS